MNEFDRVLKKDEQLIISVHHPFTYFTIFNIENYFLTELLYDECDTDYGKVKVQFYRRPISEIINSIVNWKLY